MIPRVLGDMLWAAIAGFLIGIPGPSLAQKKAAAQKDWELVRSVSHQYGGVQDLVLVPERRQRDRKHYASIGKAVCGERKECSVMFWTDRAQVPMSANMTRHMPHRTATYELDPARKEPLLRLACWLYPNRKLGEGAQCFHMPGKTYWEKEKK